MRIQGHELPVPHAAYATWRVDVRHLGAIFTFLSILFSCLALFPTGAVAASPSLPTRCEALFMIYPEMESHLLIKERPRDGEKALAWHRDVVQKAEVRLSLAGVKFQIVTVGEDRASKREVIKFSTKGTSSLNVLAANIANEFHGALRFDPWKTPYHAAYSTAQNAIQISVVEAFRAEPDESAAHEAVHMAVADAAMREKPAQFDVVLKAVGGKSENGDEIAAYAYEAHYIVGKIEEAVAARNEDEISRLYDSLLGAAELGAKHALNVERLVSTSIQSLKRFRANSAEHTLKDMRRALAMQFVGDSPRAVDLYWLNDATNGVIRTSDSRLVNLATRLYALEMKSEIESSQKLKDYDSILYRIEGQLRQISKLTAVVRKDFQRLSSMVDADKHRRPVEELRSLVNAMILPLRDQGGFEIDLGKIMPPSQVSGKP